MTDATTPIADEAADSPCKAILQLYEEPFRASAEDLGGISACGFAARATGHGAHGSRLVADVRKVAGC